MFAPFPKGIDNILLRQSVELELNYLLRLWLIVGDLIVGYTVKYYIELLR